MNRNRHRQRNIVALIIISVFMVGVVVFAVMFQRTVLGPRYFDVPEIRSDLTSSSDGKIHSVVAKFEFELDESIKSDVSVYEVSRRMEAIIKQMEYDSLIIEGSMEYMKDEIREGLSDYIDPDKLVNIYVWDFVTDDDTVISSSIPSNLQPLLKTFDAIFQKK